MNYLGDMSPGDEWVLCGEKGRSLEQETPWVPCGGKERGPMGLGVLGPMGSRGTLGGSRDLGVLEAQGKREGEPSG